MRMGPGFLATLAPEALKPKPGIASPARLPYFALHCPASCAHSGFLLFMGYT